jgi:hypothetical protein
MTKLLQHSLALKGEIEAFAAGLDHPMPIPEGTWDRLTALFQVFSTFNNATAPLEAQSFGTISRVYDWLCVIRRCCERVIEDGLH